MFCYFYRAKASLFPICKSVYLKQSFACRNEYRRDLPDVKSIKGWSAKFEETGCAGVPNRLRRDSVNEEIVDAVLHVFPSSS